MTTGKILTLMVTKTSVTFDMHLTSSFKNRGDNAATKIGCEWNPSSIFKPMAWYKSFSTGEKFFIE